MILSDALKDKLLDTRLREKLLRDGTLTKEELEQYKNSLEDDHALSERVDDNQERS